MPPDNAATVAPGGAVGFPRNGPRNGSISRLSASTFQLGSVGTYRVSFVVPVTEPGQLTVRLNSVDLPYTVVGRGAGVTPIVGESLITTAAPNAMLAVVNPADNSTALTITPLAGGTEPVSASLVIQKLR